MRTVALSESAVAVLRFRVKGWRFTVRERDLDAYGELVEAGIMEPDGKDYRFTDGGWARREELLAAAEAHLRSLEPRLPDRLELSRAASRTLARHLAGDHAVTAANRGDYRESSRSRRRSFSHFSPIFGPYTLVIRSVSNDPASALVLFPTTAPPVPC
jgi:hypothetical protein